jgi:hypothetical protein
MKYLSFDFKDYQVVDVIKIRSALSGQKNHMPSYQQQYF